MPLASSVTSRIATVLEKLNAWLDSHEAVASFAGNSIIAGTAGLGAYYLYNRITGAGEAGEKGGADFISKKAAEAGRITQAGEATATEGSTLAGGAAGSTAAEAGALEGVTLAGSAEAAAGGGITLAEGGVAAEIGGTLLAGAAGLLSAPVIAGVLATTAVAGGLYMGIRKLNELSDENNARLSKVPLQSPPPEPPGLPFWQRDKGPFAYIPDVTIPVVVKVGEDPLLRFSLKNILRAAAGNTPASGLSADMAGAHGSDAAMQMFNY